MDTILSASLGHSGGLKSLENEIKSRVAQSRNKTRAARETKAMIEEQHKIDWKRNLDIAKYRKSLDTHVDEKKNRGNSCCC